MIVMALGVAFGVASSFAAESISVTGNVSPANIGPGSTDIGNTVNLFVGNTASGTMTVNGGATFSGRAFFIGENSGANGVMTVSGTGSQATANMGMGVGRSGTGTLDILSSATVRSNLAGSFSTVVGEFAGGKGTINVFDGSLLSVGTNLLLGLAATAHGTLNIGGLNDEGKAALVDVTRAMTVGSAGTGTVNVNTGGSLIVRGTENTSLQIGNSAGGTGTVNINGGAVNVYRTAPPPAGQQVTGPFVGVGGQSNGILNVTNGGTLTLGDAASAPGTNMGIGGNNTDTATGHGAMLVSGPGSKVELLGANQVTNIGRGNGSTGSLTIADGGVFNGGLNMHIGRGLLMADGVTPREGFGATGTVIVDGLGSQLNLKGVQTATGAGAFINVGREAGTGTLTISNNGRVSIDGTGSDPSAGSAGLAVGRDAASRGTLNVESGGLLDIKGDGGVALLVGRLGDGELNVKGGGKIALSNTGTGGGGLVFGGAGNVLTGGTFAATISDPGSSLILSGINMVMRIGFQQGSAGTVTINGGATVDGPAAIIVATEVGSSGSLNIAGAGTTINIATSTETDEFGGRLMVGRSGIGTSTVSGGAVVNIDGTVGSQAAGIRVGGVSTGGGGTGTLTVTGDGSKVVTTGSNQTFTVGRDPTNGATPSTGTVIISDGGRILHAGPGARGSIGYSPGSTGTVTVTGDGSRLEMGTNSFLGIGRSVTDDLGGIGVLNVTNGGYVQATSIHVGATGTITGSGTIDGSIFNEGVINPGNSPGTLRIINGTLTQGSNGKVILEIEEVGGQIVHDKLIFDPVVVPQLGKVEFVFLGDMSPATVLAQHPGILDIDNFLLAEVSGNEVSLSQALDQDLLEQFQQQVQTTVFTGSAGDGSLLVSFSDYQPFTGLTGAVTVTLVPEPHEYAMMLAGLALVAWRLRRQRQIRL